VAFSIVYHKKGLLATQRIIYQRKVAFFLKKSYYMV